AGMVRGGRALAHYVLAGADRRRLVLVPATRLAGFVARGDGAGRPHGVDAGATVHPGGRPRGGIAPVAGDAWRAHPRSPERMAGVLMSEQARALGGVRVIDISLTPAAAWASRLLADAGADVILVEPPAGNPIRRTGPFTDDGASVPAAQFLANKRSITLDLADAAARGTVR